MTQTAPGVDNTLATKDVLHVALELSKKTWKLGFLASSSGGKPRIRGINAGNWKQLEAEIGKAKRRFGLSEETQVVSCYEAGRDAFWIHRILEERGIHNVVVDPASIEVDRRKRKRKTDRLDASKLVTRLVRHESGEKRVWSVVRVPTETQEDQRRLHRERERLVKERSQHTTRIRALLATKGIDVKNVREPIFMRPDGSPLRGDLAVEIKREQQRLALLDQQLKEVEAEQKGRLETKESLSMERVGLLASLRGIGRTSSWVLVMEMFAWRPFENRRKAASLVGLTGTPFDSGGSVREQGINKAGNRRVRALMVELSWLWLRYQPDSQLSRWFTQRFSGSGRMKRIGIVAMARRLFIDLWKLVERGEVPAGARFKSA